MITPPAMTTAPIRSSAARPPALMAAMLVAFCLAATLIIAYEALLPGARLTLTIGQVAFDDILAPISLTYESAVLTALARDEAARAVPDAYDPPTPSILRQQIQRARAALSAIDSLRRDPASTTPQRAASLSALSESAALNLSASLIVRALTLSDEEWKQVDGQVISLLERTMRGEIRDSIGGLTAIFDTLPNLVSFNVNERQSELIVALARSLIRPNAFFNAERTQRARDEAAAHVPPVTRQFVQGQIVVRGGTVITAADSEALGQLRLVHSPDQRLSLLLGAALAVVLACVLLLAYLYRFERAMLADPARLAVVGLLFLGLLLGAQALIDPQQAFLSHLYPMAAFTLVTAAIFNGRVALAAGLALAFLIGIIAGNSLEFALLAAAGSVAGVLAFQRSERIQSFFAAGLAVGVATAAVSVLFALLAFNHDLVEILALIPAGLLNGAMSAGLGLVLLYLSSAVLNLPTGVRLLELSQPGHPLLQRLLREAPGTYQHSLQVANLAELAAERIGANAALVRVGALYHDIGKLAAPYYFAENQAEGGNPHDALRPEQSARIIIGHVTEGEKLGRAHRLPAVLLDFIGQHHGTTLVMYFYCRAVERSDQGENAVSRAPFTYPGPRPQTREAAVMMLADSCESVVRSRRPHDKAEVAQVIDEVIQARRSAGQLEESGLSLHDLTAIQEVFVSSLQGLYHPRVAYPPLPRTTQEMPAALSPMSGATAARPGESA